MKKLFVILWITIFGQVASFAQGYWAVKRFKDEFGDPIPGVFSQYAQNTSIRNDYSGLNIYCGVNSHDAMRLWIEYQYNTSYGPELRELSAPATLSIKTRDGKVHRFSSNDDSNGSIWFTGNDAMAIAKLLEERNYSIALIVKSYLDGSKTYRYSVYGTTQGLFATLRRMYKIR